MPVNDTTALNFLYRFEVGSQTFTYSDIALGVPYNDEDYTKIQIQHTSPLFSERPEEAEIDITIHEAATLPSLFLNPLPYSVKVQIYERDFDTEEVTPYYRGWVVRAPFRLTDSVVQLHCKTVWHYFDRASLVDSLSALSRYSVYDPRAGVDVESLRTGITVTAFNDLRDILTVTGITDLDGWFDGGIIRAPNNDRRTILKHITESGDVHLYLNGAFDEFTLSTGFSADIFPGDDLTYETWANKFSTETNNGEKFGGWPYMPNVDPALRGVS